MTKIGIWVRYGFNQSVGGGFSYFDALLSTLKTYKFRNDFELVFVSPASRSGMGESCVNLGLIPNNIPFLSKLLQNERIAKLFLTVNSKLLKKHYRKKLETAGVSLLYYACQDDFILTGFPYVATLWDMGYYKTYPFPELIQGRNFNGRKKIFTEILPKALLVFVESEAGKIDLVKYSNITEDKVKVIPMFPGNVVNMDVDVDTQKKCLYKYSVEQNEYFFYPAQFWAHKNHITLVNAFAKFQKKNPKYKLVFTGSNKGTLDYIKEVSTKLGIDNCVLFLGFLSNEEIFSLYKNATALIMGSFFGPTNMPPIEAMHLGCPVICSDIEGHREIMQDAGLYFDPTNSDDLLLKMNELINNRDKYLLLTKSVKDKSKFNISTSIQSIDDYLNIAASVRGAWK